MESWCTSGTRLLTSFSRGTGRAAQWTLTSRSSWKHFGAYLSGSSLQLGFTIRNSFWHFNMKHSIIYYIRELLEINTEMRYLKNQGIREKLLSVERLCGKVGSWRCGRPRAVLLIDSIESAEVASNTWENYRDARGIWQQLIISRVHRCVYDGGGNCWISLTLLYESWGTQCSWLASPLRIWNGNLLMPPYIF